MKEPKWVLSELVLVSHYYIRVRKSEDVKNVMSKGLTEPMEKGMIRFTIITITYRKRI